MMRGLKAFLALALLWLASVPAYGQQVGTGCTPIGRGATTGFFSDCAVATPAAGSPNAIILTPTFGQTPITSTLAKYASYRFQAAATNTATTTIRLGASGPGPYRVYTNGSAGVVEAKGGELVIGNWYAVTFDPLLNTNLGGWVITSGSMGSNNFTDRVIAAAGYFGAAQAASWNTLWSFGTDQAPVQAVSRVGSAGLYSASRTSDGSGGVSAAVAGVRAGFNDRTAADVFAWGGYDSCFNYIAGGCHGIEVDPVNFSTVVQLTPYGIFKPGSTNGLWIASGGNCTVAAPCYNPATGLSTLVAANNSVAIGIVPNGAAHSKGIVFGRAAIAGTDGNAVTGVSPAIQMAKGHSQDWLACANLTAYPANCGDGFVAAQILSTASGMSVRQLFTTGLVSFQDNGAGTSSVSIATNSSHVNSILLAGSITTAPTTFSAIGADTNIGISLVPKGTGTVKSGTSFQHAVTTVSGLPTCNAATEGTHYGVTDANATLTAGIGTVVAGGGANRVPVYCDQTNWRIGG